MDTLFGEPGKSSSASGVMALPKHMRGKFNKVGGSLLDYSLDNPDAFRPIDITQGEQTALDMISREFTPEMVQETISPFFNPYQDIVLGDINRAYEDEFSALSQLASQAGAFGSSKYKENITDVEDARLRARASANQSYYDRALQTGLGQRQQQIGNLMSGGQFQRDLALQQSIAPFQAYSTALQGASPLLSTNTQQNTGASGGIAGNLAAMASAFTPGGSYSNPNTGASPTSSFQTSMPSMRLAPGDKIMWN